MIIFEADMTKDEEFGEWFRHYHPYIGHDNYSFTYGNANVPKNHLTARQDILSDGRKIRMDWASPSGGIEGRWFVTVQRRTTQTVKGIISEKLAEIHNDSIEGLLRDILFAHDTEINWDNVEELIYTHIPQMVL